MSTEKIRLGTWSDISLRNSKHNERKELAAALLLFVMVFIILYTILELVLPDVRF